MSEVREENKETALIVPIYSYDPRTLQLVKREKNDDISMLIKPVGVQNGKYLLEDVHPHSTSFAPSVESSRNYDCIPNVIANAQSLVAIFTALYENRAFSKVFHLKLTLGCRLSTTWAMRS